MIYHYHAIKHEKKIVFSVVADTKQQQQKITESRNQPVQQINVTVWLRRLTWKYQIQEVDAQKRESTDVSMCRYSDDNTQ